MSPARDWRTTLLERTGARTLPQAATFLFQYAALRAWNLLISLFPLEWNLATARLIARGWYYLPLLRRHRQRALENLRAAFGDSHSPADYERIARGSFEHFAQVYLVEALRTPEVITEFSWSRYVELTELGPALRQLLLGRGTIMLTGHFGNYELLGFTICRLGVPLHAVMRPLDNRLITAYIERTRQAGGLTLLHKKGVTESAHRILSEGGTLCFIADQDAGRKGVFVEFFGRPASTYKSLALLAMQFDVPIIVGQCVRLRRGFRYRMEVERIIQPDEWKPQDDPLRWITQTFSSAMEAAIRRHPEQYLWMHRRWKSQPRAGKSESTMPTKAEDGAMRHSTAERAGAEEP